MNEEPKTTKLEIAGCFLFMGVVAFLFFHALPYLGMVLRPFTGN